MHLEFHIPTIAYMQSECQYGKVTKKILEDSLLKFILFGCSRECIAYLQPVYNYCHF